MAKMAKTERPFTENDMDEYKDTFTMFDKEGDGKVGCENVADICRALGWNPTNKAVKKCTGDKDKYHRFTFEEVLPMLKEISHCDVGTTEDFLEALKVFDKEGQGIMSGAELRHVLTSLGEKLTDDEMEILMVGQENSSGEVNYEDFVDSVMIKLEDQ
ncbi:myosin light chain 3, skeletal muscle isoform-like isoform X2 [Amphiura filiformis]|uniref:myosin light chain 3, skeletal muscle isoform-like isoform X2 n=1 Tax=Amphiura filiformis TaxID=82378 RepID=UPI003B216056